MSLVFLSLGSNLMDPQKQLTRALQELQNSPFVTDFKSSSFYASEAVSPIPQPDFVNSVCSFKYKKSLSELFYMTQMIEAELGKKPKAKDEPRPIDIDILFFSSLETCEGGLEIPHKSWKDRSFVLRPLLELLETIQLGQTKYHIPTVLQSQRDRFPLDDCERIC